MTGRWLGERGLNHGGPMKVLYVNHTGQMSGGEHSLLELVRGASPGVTPIVACPDGPLVDALRDVGVPSVSIPGIDASLKLHPRHTTLALSDLARSARAVRAAARRHDVSVVHANSIRAGLLPTVIADRHRPPTIVHLRDRLPASRISTLTLRVISRADLLIANSHYTAASLDEAGVACSRRVIGNPVDLDRFDPDRIDRSAARAALDVAEGDYVASVLAQITPWKGQQEAILAIARVREEHPNVKLLLVGSAKFVSKTTRYDNRAYLDNLGRLVERLRLHDHVRFLGESDDVPSLLRATDALLIPSWEEPFGRSMIEAMAMGVPVIATTVGGPAEVITQSRDGMLVPPRKAEAWAQAIQNLIKSPGLHTRLARNGRLRARAFAVEAHAEELRSVYLQVLNRRHSQGEAPAGVAAPPLGGTAVGEASATPSARAA
jgi:glycosyltransferase involved in cell wall biosynthesis